jgi:hypothetical protein
MRRILRSIFLDNRIRFKAIKTYKLALPNAAIAKIEHALLFFASDKIINTFCTFALMAQIECKMTGSFSILSLRAIPSLY